MTDAPNKTPEDTRIEVKERLEAGESPEDIHEDDDMPSRRTVYSIKSEWEEKKERQEEMEKEVFNDTIDAGRDEIVDVLNEAGVGVTQAGKPKAKVEKALNAIDFDQAWDDPHHVADELVQEANMSREWANRIVRKAYDQPDFPYVDRGGRESGAGGPAPRSERGRGRPRDEQRNPRERPRGRDERDRHEQERPNEQNEQLQRQMKQLQSTVSELAQTVAETQRDDDSGQQMVRIERDDGSVIEVPANHPAATQALSGGSGDDKDFMDKLREAKQAGIIPDPDDFQQDDGEDITDVITKLRDLGIIDDDSGSEEVEMMSEMMDDMSEQFAEAQENVASQMSAAIAQLADDSDDEDDELTMEDLREFWEQKEEEDKIDRLAEELDRTREELRNEMQSDTRRSKSPDQDPEVVKQRDKLDHEKEQLEMVNDTLQTLPDQMTDAVKEGFLPLYKQLQEERKRGDNPLWSPPTEEERGEPQYAPTEPDQPRQNNPRSGRGYPDVDANGDGPEADELTRERAEQVRDKLPIGSDEEDTEAEA